jgi:hypothetical protein
MFFFQFEKTADHLFDAAYYGQRDSINGEEHLVFFFDEAIDRLKCIPFI